MVWADDHLTRHRAFVCTVLAAIHDDGSHTGEGQTNRLTHFAEMRQLRVTLAEYLGTRAGLEYAALLNAMAVWGGVVI